MITEAYLTPNNYFHYQLNTQKKVHLFLNFITKVY
jgi:hypothetical protein